MEKFTEFAEVSVSCETGQPFLHHLMHGKEFDPPLFRTFDLSFGDLVGRVENPVKYNKR